MDLEESFPEIREARACHRHRNYTGALQMYVEILGDISQDSEEYSHVLLEYAQCLLECIMLQAETDYRAILEARDPVNEENVEEDLENCWECLESCRVNFEDLGNRLKLAEVFKGLGDVQCLKNMFEEGRDEYLKAIDYCEDENASIELLECIAECHRNMKQYDEAIEYYSQVMDGYSRLGMEDAVEECRCLMDGLRAIKAQSEKRGSSRPDVDGEPVNVNHLKR